MENSKINDSSTKYFPVLDIIRAFAVSLVLIDHIESNKSDIGVISTLSKEIGNNLGGLGVTFFFVLSGFLITYLLLLEIEKAGKINIKKFYLRRLLRIWPIYYVVVVVGWFVIVNIPELSHLSDNPNFNNQIIFNFLFLANFSEPFYGSLPFLNVLWSLGVEEQFYLFWPIIVTKSKNLLKSIVIISFIYIAFKGYILYTWKLGVPENSDVVKSWGMFFINSRFVNLFWGGALAYCYFFMPRSFFVISMKSLFYLSISLTLTFIFFGHYLPRSIVMEIAAIPMGIVIVHASILNKDSKFRNNFFEYIGKISYGMYIYHFFFCYFLVRWISKVVPEWGLFSNILTYIGVFLGTILLSHFSHKYFESIFLNIKNKYSIVKTKKI